MTSLSITLLLLYSLLLSGGLYLCVMFRVGGTRSLVVAVVIAVIFLMGVSAAATGSAVASFTTLRRSGILIAIPTLVVWLISRHHAMTTRAWAVVLVGPVAFCAVLVATVIVVNVLTNVR